MIQAIEANFDTSYRQRCVKHKMDNILAAVPKERHEERHGEVREELNPIFYGSTSLEQAKAHLETFRKQYSKIYPTAVDCLMRDIDQVLTFYLFPASRWKRIRSRSLWKRLREEKEAMLQQLKMKREAA